MNWDDLRVFVALRRATSFAGAARELGVNATTVARRLSALEAAIGAQLFSRTADGLVPTAAGEQIAEPSELIERQTQLIARSVGGGDARLAGRVRLSVTDSFASHFLLDQLSVFRRRHPDIELEINSSNVLVDLTRGQADIAIRHRSPGSGPGVETSGHVEILARRVCSIGIAVFASRSYLEATGIPRSAERPDGHDLIVPRAEASYLPGSAWSRLVAPRVSTALRCDGTTTMAAACAAGFGLCALPCFEALQFDNLMRISETIDTRDTWMLRPSDLRHVARVRALWDYLLELFEQWAPLLSGEVTPTDRDARRSSR